MVLTKKNYIVYERGESPKLGHPILDYIKDRVYSHNENFLLPIVGQTGSGKTYTALRFAELLDPEFSIRNVAFESASFMQLLNSGKLKQGSVIIYDESGVGHDSRNFMTKANKLFNYVMQVFRHMNIIVLFTTPSLGFMDKATRLLFHGYVRMIDKNPRTGRALAYAYLFKDDPRFGKPRDIKLRVRQGSVTKPCKQVLVRLPNNGLIENYELAKSEFSQKLRKEIEKELSYRLKDVKSVDPLTRRQREIYDLKVKGLKHLEVMKKTGVGYGSVTKALDSARRKGLDWNKARDYKEDIIKNIKKPQKEK